MPKFTPADTDWSGLMQLQLEGVRQLSSRDFLLRLKLKSDIDSLSYKKAKKDTGERKSNWLPSINLPRMREKGLSVRPVLPSSAL